MVLRERLSIGEYVGNYVKDGIRFEIVRTQFIDLSITLTKSAKLNRMRIVNSCGTKIRKIIATCPSESV